VIDAKTIKSKNGGNPSISIGRVSMHVGSDTVLEIHVRTFLAFLFLQTFLTTATTPTAAPTQIGHMFSLLEGSWGKGEIPVGVLMLCTQGIPYGFVDGCDELFPILILVMIHLEIEIQDVGVIHVLDVVRQIAEHEGYTDGSL